MDDINGRPASEAASSDYSDFYTYDAPDTQPNVSPPARTPSNERIESVTMAGDEDDDQDEDSSSEMDVSTSSRSASPEPTQEPQRTLESSLDVPHQLANKRKLSEADGAVANGTPQVIGQPSKKQRLSIPPRVLHGGVSKPLDLPVELWQHIFLYLPPAMLCRCLRVCRTFNTYLTQTKAAPAARKVPTKSQPRVRIMDSDIIWAQARKTFFPNLPRPLARCSELEMLQLIGGKTCQFCDRLPAPSLASTPFTAGPGPDGLRVFWPFGVRACGRCIESNTLRDVQILVSPAASLRFGLPYSFLTPELHFVPEIQRHLPGGIPSHLRVAKVYYSKDIENIIQEYEDARGLGAGAAEEWKKGLVNRGKEAMTDASRWEKWEGQMRLGTDLSQTLREYDLSSFSQHLEQAQSRSAGPNGTAPATVVNGANPLPQPHQSFQNGYNPQIPGPNPYFQPVYRPARTSQEVGEVRQARKTDIERRCMGLQPPVMPNVLQHMESFQNAMQITQPMTDAAWEVLKPRILAQRETAELIEHQRAEQMAALQAAIPSSAPDDSYIKPAKDVYDKEYEHAQEPLRKKLGEYADDFINGQWEGARSLDRDNCPVFAVQTMLHVRQRYLQDREAGLIPSRESSPRRSSKESTPLPEPFLSLDNMKWVYDNKIRPLTDNHRRELFICAGCAEERKPKWFAFEGLIQHYGAKHTTAFSKGNVVVHWQTAEWPEDPPFNPNPAHWIKFDRKPNEFKANGRARYTPQSGHDGSFAVPGSSKLLSENPLFSTNPQQSATGTNGYHSAAPSYHVHQHGQTSPNNVSYGYPYQAPAPAEPFVDMSNGAQVQKLSSDAREIWDALDGVDEQMLLACVRIQTMFHHVVVRFRDRFRQQPTLDLVTDALATNAVVRPVKDAHGLACKMCVAAQTDGAANYQSYFRRIAKVKSYNVSALITHFKIFHQPQEFAGGFDWTKDMIELPETQLITDLMRAPGMDDDKLAIVATAFPNAFPSPLPRIGLVKAVPRDVGPDSGLASRLLDRMSKKQRQAQRKKGLLGAIGTPGREDSQEPLPEPKEDEYDPRRPMFPPTHEQQADPARFDTDVARKASTGPSPFGNVPLGLDPATLAALNNLNALTTQTQKPPIVDDRAERSPSVGRAEPSPRLEQSNLSTKAQPPPDISAILAQLTGQPAPPQPPQTATPPTSVSARSGSAPRQSHADPYGQSQHVSPLQYREERPTSSRYAQQPTHAGSAEPVAHFDALDIQSSASRNARHFEQNRAQSYVQAPYAPPPHQSPPRLRYIYEDGQHYSQPPQQVPVYQGEAPVQYIQLAPDRSERPPPPHTYHYERSSPKQYYVDEYGRPLQLIPIDSAPAPVQYAPHPFEQQQHQQQYARRAPEVVAYSGAPPQAQYLPAAYEDRRAVYYEPAGPVAPGGQQQQRFVYDDGARSSVPRG